MTEQVAPPEEVSATTIRQPIDRIGETSGSDPFTKPQGQTPLLAVLFGNGDGSFQTAIAISAGDGTRSVAIGDVNADDKPDLIAANQNTDDVSVLLGDNNGNFRLAVTFPVHDTPYSLAVGDLNGDDLPDLVTANTNSDDVSVLIHR